MTEMQVAISIVIGTFTVLGLVEVRIAKLVKRLVKEYLTELKPNGGGSVKDKVDEIHRLLISKEDK
jgi:hypothetical protein